MKKFWSSIEEIPSQATTHVEWRDRLGLEWPLVRPFLRATGRSATSAVLPTPGGANDIFRIVRHASGQIVGISEEGDRYPLKTGDDAIYEVDRTAFTTSICKALHIVAVNGSDRIGPDIQLIGTYLMGSVRHPVFLAITAENDAFEVAVMQALASSEVTACLILTPTPRHIAGDVQRRFGTHRCCILAMSDVLAITTNGQLISIQKPEDVLLQAGNVAAGVQPRADGFYSPQTVVWLGREHKCKLSAREISFLQVGLVKEEIDAHTLMHPKNGICWKEHYLKTQKQRDKISQFISRLNTKLVDATPSVSITFTLRREADTISRT